MNEEKISYYIISVIIMIYLGIIISTIFLSKGYEKNSEMFIEKNCEFVKNEFKLYDGKLFLARKIHTCNGKTVIEEDYE